MSCAFIDKDRIKLTVNSNLQESIVTVRDELLKQGDLYDGFVASIFSVLKPKEHYIGDGESEIHAEYGAKHLAEEILNQIIGMEDGDGIN